MPGEHDGQVVVDGPARISRRSRASADPSPTPSSPIR